MRHQWLQGFVYALVVAVPVAPVSAQDEFFGIEGLDDEEPAVVTTNEIEIGLGHLSDDAFAFGKFTGLDEKGLVPMLDLRVVKRSAWDSDDAGYWSIEGNRLGLDARRLQLEFGQQGSYRVRMDYREFVNNTVGGGATPFTGVGTGVLSLPAGWVVTGPSTGEMTNLDDHLVPVDIGVERRRIGLGFERALTQRWALDLDYRRETKEGTRAVGASFGSTGGNPRAAVVPAPTDFVTDIVDIVLRYSGDAYQVGVAWHGSEFDNNERSLTWDNPFGQLAAWAPGVGYPTGQGRMALEPSNSSYQARVFGSYIVSPTTRVSADLAYGRMTQDEAFFPYTVNPLLSAPEALPRASLDGRIDTTMFTLRMSSRPAERLNLSASYRFDDRDNRTPQAAYRYVAGDSQDQKAADDARINLPYSYREQRLDLRGVWRFRGSLRVTGGYEYRDIERDFSESNGSTENTLSLGLRLQPADSLALSADLRHGKRDADPYDGTRPLVASHVPGVVGPDEFENHPLLRKYYLADRDRDQFSMRGDWSPAQSVSLGLSVSHARDDYTESVFGLNEGRARSVTLDGGFQPRDGVAVSGWFSHERLDGRQSGRAFSSAPATADDPARDWAVHNDDRIDSAGLNIEADTGRNIDLGAEAMLSRARTDLDVRAGAALTVAPFPQVVSRLNGYSLYGRYHLSDVSSVRLGVEHERVDTVDFAFDGVLPATVSNVLSLGNVNPDYSVTWFTATFRYRF